MRNSKIVKAWDTVSPTDSQKKQMRVALEARLTADEKPGKRVEQGEGFPNLTTMDYAIPEPEKKRQSSPTPTKQKPRYQMVQPKKKRGSGFALIAAMLAVAVTGGLFLGMMNGWLKENSNYARPTEPLTVPTTADTEAARLPDAYQKVIEVYVSAIEEGWNPEQCNNANISILTANVQSTDDLGYALIDLDRDGEEELLITDGNVIYSLYSLTPAGETVCFITGMERDAYYLSYDGIIANVGSSGAAISYYIFYSFSNDTLDVIRQVTYDANTNPENPWFTGEMEENISEEKANELIDAYPHRYIPHTTLSGQPPLPEAELPEEDILELYAEKMPPFVYGNMSQQYQLYCFFDFDGDGKTELLLGAGQSIYMAWDEAAQVKENIAPFYVSPTGAAYPCEDGVMEYIGYNQGYSYYSYLSHEEANSLDYLFCNEEGWFHRPENGEDQPVSQAEAEAIRAKYKRLNLPWKSIKEFPVPIPETVEDTAQALYENVFLPIAVSGEKPTEAELKAKIKENGYQWNLGEGQIYCYATQSGGASVGADLASTTGGGLGNELVYFLPGDIDRWVAVCWKPDGVHYFTGVDSVLDGVEAQTVEALQEFLNADEETIALRQVVEGFARSYFGRDETGMLKWTASGVTVADGKMFYGDVSVMVVMIGGLEDAQEQYEKAGHSGVSVEILPEGSDSYDFLEMDMVKENGEWKVQSWFLQK